jgi:hypothetical protein
MSTFDDPLFAHNNAPSVDHDEEPLWSSATLDEPEEEGADNEALYAVLNLPKDCSEEDIQKSYKRLASEYWECGWQETGRN